MSARFTMSLAAACAPSRSTLARVRVRGARAALLFVAGLASTKRRSSRLALHPDCNPVATAWDLIRGSLLIIFFLLHRNAVAFCGPLPEIDQLAAFRAKRAVAVSLIP